MTINNSCNFSFKKQFAIFLKIGKYIYACISISQIGVVSPCLNKKKRMEIQKENLRYFNSLYLYIQFSLGKHFVKM